MDKRFVAGLIFAMSVARGQTPGSTGKLTVTVGKSLIIDSPVNIRSVSVANGELIEAIAVNPREVLINGKTPGETSVVIEQVNGNRLVYDLTVGPRPAKLEEVRQQISREFPDDNIDVSYENDTALVRGTVKDVIAADRVIAIVATLGKTINLLRVDVPPFEGQTSLRVRFASVDRDVETDLGLNLISAAPIIDSNSGGVQPIPSVNQLVNVFLFRPDINLLSTLRALEARNALEMLAEPNVMAIDGKQASFVAGGVFPFPTMQAGAVTIQFREIGVRLNFLPNITRAGPSAFRLPPKPTPSITPTQLPSRVSTFRPSLPAAR